MGCLVLCHTLTQTALGLMANAAYESYVFIYYTMFSIHVHVCQLGTSIRVHISQYQQDNVVHVDKQVLRATDCTVFAQQNSCCDLFRGIDLARYCSCSWSRSSTHPPSRNSSSESLTASTKQSFRREGGIGDDHDRDANEMQLSPPSLSRRGTFAVSSEPDAARKSASGNREILYLVDVQCSVMVW